MLTADFDYALPPELIAQEPLAERTLSRMMVLEGDRAPQHACVTDLRKYLRPGDLLVMNDTRVFPARVFGRWQDTTGKVEVLFIERGQGERTQNLEPRTQNGEVWRVMMRSARPVKEGRRVVLAEGSLLAEVVGKEEGGIVILKVMSASGAPCAVDALYELLNRYGVPPLPPYIHRTEEERGAMDRERYQTVYAREVGAVAAPTAGLHFTPGLLDELAAAGIPHVFVTLHVGPGTFKPVKTDDVEKHVMDPERYTVSQATADAIAQTRRAGGRIVAVGSTTVRTLETVAAEHGGVVVPCEGRSRAFIYPPYAFAVTDAMLTNFHLPRSTLLMMVSALMGRERILAAYRLAIAERYRFFSYGDCMLLIP
ncbi:MAG: tRNA preQ1(34) S-adenosylmethionine ribosyltransferase-isomerase QueA [Kiritimatiellaeota bacterium]|nr:tRNA preQ1(34) S-adenosylmethionine ribosyltransferase-isomerase QueA [Kiritimatiellota bacterium]